MMGEEHYNQILLIEDDPDDQELFIQALEESSHQTNCFTESSATSALEKLRGGQLDADLIFLDLNMPGMNGFDFLREAKSDPCLCYIPIIILTTSSQASDKLTTLTLGAKNFLTKPNNFRELIAMISQQLT
jgi:CheY-like chemotaxis protein